MPFDSEAKLRDVGKKNLLPDTHRKKKFWKALCYISIYIYIYIYIHTYHIYIYVCTHISYRYIYIYCTWIEKGNPSSALFQTVGITAQSDVSCLKESTDQVCISVQLCCKPNCMNQSIYCFAAELNEVWPVWKSRASDYLSVQLQSWRIEPPLGGTPGVGVLVSFQIASNSYWQMLLVIAIIGSY